MDRPPLAHLPNHSLRRVVLPKPAGAETSVNLRPGPRSSLSVNRGRGTRLERSWDGRSLVDTSESDAMDTWFTSGTYSTSDRRHPIELFDNRSSRKSAQHRSNTYGCSGFSSAA